jgi:hypothetical protein
MPHRSLLEQILTTNTRRCMWTYRTWPSRLCPSHMSAKFPCDGHMCTVNSSPGAPWLAFRAEVPSANTVLVPPCALLLQEDT